MIEEHIKESHSKKDTNNSYLIMIGIIIATGILAFGMVYSAKIKSDAVNGSSKPTANSEVQVSELENKVLPSAGVELPATWGDLGRKLVESGVIDQKKFETLYSERGGMSEEMKALLTEKNNGKIKMTPENSAYLLNLFWALGLGQSSEILTAGPMSSTPTIPPQNFASTGGWTLGNGSVMSHFSKHNFLNLTPEQFRLVEEVARNIYRPCCGNSTYFPDCNHGMGMLGLLELMASQGANKEDMYKAALVANSYWFPDTYMTIAQYFEASGVSWDKVDAKTVLGEQYSSSAGFRQLVQSLQSPIAGQEQQATTPARRQSGGCGI